MTMSVGLAKIQNDPNATPMTRKALGALSTPGLLVHDTGLSIDGEGRIYIKLKAEGGILQDENGLYLEPEPIVIGVDSHVDLFSDEHDRQWNARLTGSAPNFIESGLAIGTEDFSGTFSSPDANYDIPKVSITSPTAQMRIAYDKSSFTQVKVFDGGRIGLFSVGSDPGIYLESGDGVNVSGGLILNRGTPIERIVAYRANNVVFPGGGSAGVTSISETFITFLGDDVALYPIRPEQDIAIGMPLDGVFLPPEVGGWTVRISSTNVITIRVMWVNVWAGAATDWLFLVHRMPVIT